MVQATTTLPRHSSKNCRPLSSSDKGEREETIHDHLSIRRYISNREGYFLPSSSTETLLIVSLKMVNTGVAPHSLWSPLPLHVKLSLFCFIRGVNKRIQQHLRTICGKQPMKSVSRPAEAAYGRKGVSGITRPTASERA
eukprot:gene7373-5188_t